MAERVTAGRIVVGEDGLVRIAGLGVPAPLVPRLIAAIRGEYPTVVAGLDDDAAVRAFLRYIMTTTLAAHESRTTEAPVEDEVRTVRKDFERRALEARTKAVSDASAITDAPSLPDEVIRALRS